MKNIVLVIEGMTCSACSNGLEKYLNKQNGIINASVNLVMANATIDYDENILDIEKIERYVKQAGFNSKGIFKEIKMEKKSKFEKIKFIVFSVLAVLLMYISMGHMINLPVPGIVDLNINPIGYTCVLFFLSILFLLYGCDILKNGYKNLIHFIPNMDTLVGIGVVSSFLYSLYGMYRVINGDYNQVTNLYFESTAIVIYFVKFGRYLDGISKDKTKEAIQKLVEITPNQATLEVNGKEKVVTLDLIKKNNILISKPGEKIAVDGEIIEGNAHFDESFITGESKPSEKNIGDKVVAGSVNYDGYIKYKAERIGKESTVSEIVRLVIEASNTKAPIARIADRISGFFVPTVIFIAVLTFIVYMFLGFEFKTAIETFVTVLVVACPCSLGLAMPLAVVVSEGLCVTNGILVKNSEVLENAAKVDTIVFDKTGTLTYGNMKIYKFFNYEICKGTNECKCKDANNEDTNYSDREIFEIVGSLESKSSHPIALAFAECMRWNNIELIDVTDFKNIPGQGIQGIINGENFFVGNAKLLENYNIKNMHKNDENILAEEGNSIVYLANEKEVLALIGINDVVRDNVENVICELGSRNIKTVMLTGDNKETAEKVADRLGINEVIAGVMPAEKVDMIKKLKKENSFVMMCGDGVNDSPALASADIGVSMKSGTDIAMDSSDVVLVKNDLNAILKLIIISKNTLKNIKQNLFWAFFYNVLMIPIAIGILRPWNIAINPMIASFAMVMSSLTVVFNVLRLKRIKF